MGSNLKIESRQSLTITISSRIASNIPLDRPIGHFGKSSLTERTENASNSYTIDMSQFKSANQLMKERHGHAHAHSHATLFAHNRNNYCINKNTLNLILS